MATRHWLWLSIALVACEGRDLGPLLEPVPCSVCAIDAGSFPDASLECGASTATIGCGLGACAREVLACDDGHFGVCVPGEPLVEACNDVDDDCDGVIDDGCDDDRDGFCDAAMVVTSSPAVCRKGRGLVLDCDDDDANRYPGRPEICDDGLDNDCNDFADYLDINGCAHLTASFQDSDGIVTLEHGTTQLVQAQITPPSLEIERVWVVTNAAPDTHCLIADVTLSEPEETAALTKRRVSILDDPSRLDCAYRIELQVGGVTADAIELRMRNTRPRVDVLTGATLDDTTLVLEVAAGTIPRLIATEPTDPDQPVVVSWTGTNAGLLDCTAPCEGLDVRFAAAPAPGRYTFTINARDGFDGINRGRSLRIEVRPCTWVRSGGTGLGTGPALTDAFGSLVAAVSAAAATSADVCIAGTGRLGVSAPLELPLGVGIAGGFNTAGLPSTTVGAIRINNGAHIGFAPGSTAAIRRVVVDASSGTTLFDVGDASPSFVGADLVVPLAPGARAILFATGAANATIRLASTTIRSNGATTDATGIEVVGADTGVARLVWNGASAVTLTGCSGVCRGIWLHGSVSGLLNAERVEVESSGPGAEAIGIDVASEGARVATAEIVSITQIIAHTSQMDPADVTIGVRLARTDGARIADNPLIGATTQVAGRRFAAGIADGAIRRDGTIVRGDSRNLRITGNRQVGAGRSPYAYLDATCEDEPGAREGSDVAAGIVLVGTSTVELSGNGNPSSRDTAVFGGAGSSAWDPATRVLPPAAPGIWTIATKHVSIVANELRPGVLATDEGCPALLLPSVAAVRDGLGARVADPLPSEDLRLERNGIVSGRRSSFDGIAGLDVVPVRMVELFGGLRGTARLTNNYVAATRGQEQVALHVFGAGEVTLWNNVFEVDSLSAAGVALQKRALLFDGASANGIELYNNIVLIRQKQGDAVDSIAVVTTGDGISVLHNNLFFVESAERGQGGAYVEVDGVEYSRTTFPDFEAAIDGRANLILPPLFRAQSVEQRRSLSRLSDRSPARDMGQLEGAPSEDRFGGPRPIGPGVDIGHHELVP